VKNDLVNVNVFDRLSSNFEEQVLDRAKPWQDRVELLNSLGDLVRERNSIAPSKRLYPLLNALNLLLQDPEPNIVAPTLRVLTLLVKRMVSANWKTPGEAILPSLFANFHHHKDRNVLAALNELLVYFLEEVLSWTVMWPHTKTGLTTRNPGIRMNFLSFYENCLKSQKKDELLPLIQINNPLIEICNNDKEQKCRRKASEIIADVMKDSESVLMLVESLRSLQPTSYSRITRAANISYPSSPEKSEKSKQDFSIPANAMKLPINKANTTGFWFENNKTVTICLDTKMKLSRKDITLSCQSNSMLMLGIKGDILLRGKLKGPIRDPSRLAFRNIYDPTKGVSRVSVGMKKTNTGMWGQLMMFASKKPSDLPEFNKSRTTRGSHLMKRTVMLNIGGQEFSTTVETLLKDKDSRLAKMVMNRIADGSWQGNYFWDRDPTNFRHILNFLREGPEYLTNTGLLEGPDNILYQLKGEARYYNIKSLITVLVEHERQFSGRAPRQRSRPNPTFGPSEKQALVSASTIRKKPEEVERTSTMRDMRDTLGGDAEGPTSLTKDVLRRHNRQASHIRKDSQWDETISMMSEVEAYSEVESLASYSNAFPNEVNLEQHIAQLKEMNLPEKQRIAYEQFLLRLKEIRDFLRKRNDKLKLEREKFRKINDMMHRKRAQLVQFREKCMKCQKELRVKYGELHERERRVKERENECEDNRKKMDMAREQLEEYHKRFQNISQEAQEVMTQKMKLENEKSQLEEAVKTWQQERVKLYRERETIESARDQVTKVIEKLKHEKKDLEIGEKALVAKRRNFSEREAELEDRLAAFEDEQRQHVEDMMAYRSQYDQFEADKSNFDELVRKLKRDKEEIQRKTEELENRQFVANKEHLARGEALQRQEEDLEQAKTRFRKKHDEASSKGGSYDNSALSDRARELSRREKELNKEKGMTEASISREKDEIRRTQQELKNQQEKFDEQKRKLKISKEDLKLEWERLAKDRSQLEAQQKRLKLGSDISRDMEKYDNETKNQMLDLKLELEERQAQIKRDEKRLKEQRRSIQDQYGELTNSSAQRDLKHKERELSNQLEEVEQMKQDADYELRRLKNERQELQQQKLRLREEIEQEEKDLEKKRAQYVEERRAWNKTKFQDAALSDDIEREYEVIAKEKAKLRKGHRKMDKDQKDLERMYDELQRSLNLQNIDMRSKQGMFASINAEVEKLCQTRRKLTSELDDVSEEREKLAEEKQKVAKMEAELQQKTRDAELAERKRATFESNLKQAEEKIRKQERELSDAKLLNDEQQIRLRQWENQLSGKNNALDNDRRKQESEFEQMRRKYEEEKKRMESVADKERQRLQEQTFELVKEQRRLRDIYESQEKELKLKLSKKEDEIDQLKRKLLTEKREIDTRTSRLELESEKLELRRKALEKKKEEIEAATIRKEAIENRTKLERARAEKLAEDLRAKLREERAKLEEEKKLLTKKGQALDEDKSNFEKLKAKGVGGPAVPRGNRHGAVEWRKLEQERANLQAMAKKLQQKDKNLKHKAKELQLEHKRLDMVKRGGR